jgi:S1-C subfamily serine protease
MLRQHRIGASVELTLLREGQERRIPVTLAASPRLPREMRKYRDESFEFTVRDIAFSDRVAERWSDDQRGVLVEEVTEGGWAALGHLAVDDLIVAVDGKPVEDVAALRAAMTRVAQDRARSVVIQVRRGIHHLYIELEPAWPRPAASRGSVGRREP